ncbi:MAG: hypothetical protein K940chlam3_01325 [Chlamydiae bacterium]|nr:hypothetical protein [Chlamydiota bacterium]
MDNHEKSFEDILRDVKQRFEPAEPEEEELEAFPLMDTVDKEILMHREAHFGGKFLIMLEYYAVGGKGVHPEFDIKRIEKLHEIETTMQENLAPILLSGSDAEKIGQAKDAYKSLRELYEQENPRSKLPKLIADLILSEEEEAEEEVQAIIQEKNKIIPLLLDLLKSEDFHDPLFPGYGHAPFLAAKCLGLMGEERAIFSLFESLGDGDFWDEKMVLQALAHSGDPAKEFLLKVIASQPIEEDNERAALALIAFQDDPRVGETCLKLLQKPGIFEHDSFATYLILVCEGIKNSDQRKEFGALLERDDVPDHLKADIQAIVNSWK